MAKSSAHYGLYLAPIISKYLFEVIVGIFHNYSVFPCSIYLFIDTDLQVLKGISTFC